MFLVSGMNPGERAPPARGDSPGSVARLLVRLFVDPMTFLFF